MNSVHHSIPADPAYPEPSEGRAESCTCCGGMREPDPTDFFIGMLKEVARHSAELSSLVVVEARKAVEAAEPMPTDAGAPLPAAGPRTIWYPAAALANSRLTRSLRLCMSLAVKFHEDRLAREDQIARVQKAAVEERKNRLKTHVKRLVGDAIERQFEREKLRLIESEDEYYDEQIEVEKERELYRTLLDRLDEEDIEQDLGERSEGEIIVRLCLDLGVEPDLERWGTEHWALEEARRKVPGSPFAGTAVPEKEDAPAAVDPPSG